MKKDLILDVDYIITIYLPDLKSIMQEIQQELELTVKK